jgi:glyoxylase-like metal-dependent hydrolase (beta-lactamase superfamily II)
LAVSAGGAGGGIVHILAVELQEAVKGDDAAIGAQPGAAGLVGQVDHGLVQFGRLHLAGDGPRTRLAERQQSLEPWVPRDMPLLAPDRYLDRDESFTLGGLQFQVRHIGPAHTAEDLMLLVKEDGVAFVGDLIFTGRVPFVGDADSRAWLAAIDRILVDRPAVLVPGHGPASRDPQGDLVLTRDYLLQLRKVMGDAVRDFVPVDEAVKGADWSRFAALPAFEAAHRINAYGTYLQMEREALAAPR